MAHLVIKLAGGATRDILLTKERITFGRRPGCDVVLEDPSVSGEHASILTLLGDSFLEDLGSTNGTYVNGERITKRHLQPGDEVWMGRQRFAFVDPNAPARPMPEPAHPDMIDENRHVNAGDRQTAESVQPEMAMAAATVVFTGAQLIIIDGRRSGEVVLLSDEETKLGDGADSVLIVRRPLGFFAKSDAGVAHVNGRAIGEAMYPLQPKDKIAVGGMVAQFILG